MYERFTIWRRVHYVDIWHWECIDCGAKSISGFSTLSGLVFHYEIHVAKIHQVKKEEEPF